ncbi:hypothetical protein Tco_0287316 [Tanacetum coccineum]
MRPCGCLVTILNTLDPLGKFNGKSDEGFFVGYSINSKAFRVFNTRSRKVGENLHITFLENKPNVARSRPDWLFDIDLLTNSMNYEPVTTGNQTNKNAGIKDNTQQYILLPLLYHSPQSSKDAVADDAGKKTNEEPANEGERNDQEKEGGASNKEDDQNVQDFRAALDNLLVQQKEGYANNTNRDSTVSPSVSTAGQSFTNADDLPTDPRMPDLEDTTDLLNTSIFSGAYDDEDVGAEADLNNLETTMNVSPISTTRIYRDHLKDQIIGDINSTTQTRRMTKISEELAMVYVDDIIFGSTKTSLCIEFEGLMHKKFQMSYMGGARFLLRVAVKTASTPIETNKALLKDKEGEDVDVYLYRSMIRSLMYLTASRLDIMFAVCACARFQVTPKTPHLHAVKRILRYLKGQSKLGLWYPRDSLFDLEAFSDSDYAGASLDRKSIIGGCQFLSKRLISWQCKKKTIVANSTIEAEYVAPANCHGQFVDHHNMVACLERTEENAEFYQIVDFLTTSSIYYALIISLTEPFNDTYETPKHTKKVFTNMKRIGKDFSRRVTPLFASMLAPPVVGGEGSRQPFEPQPPSSTTQPIIEEQIPVTELSVPIPNVADEDVFKERDDRVVRATTTAASLDAAQASGNITKTQTTTMSNDPLSQEIGSGDRPRCQEAMGSAIAHTRVLALEQSKTAQDLVINKMQKKVKILEKALRARTPGMKLFKIGTSRRKGLDKENVSKQERKSDKTKPVFKDSDFDVLDYAMENVEGCSM